MIGWFKDAALTLPVTASTPKWFSTSLKGQTKTSSLWLGDPYFTIVSAAVSASDAIINLIQTDELPVSGTVTIGVDTITYTGRTPDSITGCSGVDHAHTVGTKVYPVFDYTSSGDIVVLVSGMAAGPVQLALAVPTHIFGFPGVPALYAQTTLPTGVAGALQVNIQVAAPAGTEQEFTNLAVTVTPLTRPGDAATSDVDIILQPLGSIFVQRRDQGLAQRLRLLPANRQVFNNLPGFVWGDYRWRDSHTENAQSVIPTRWDLDTNIIGPEKFIGGVASIGESNDIEPLDLEEKDSSIFLRVRRGGYFTGVNRYYLPSENFNLEFLPAGLGNTQFLLKKLPREQTPIFVGTWRLDGKGFYEFSSNYRYVFGSFDNNDPGLQFLVSHKIGSLQINRSLQSFTVLLGLLSGEDLEIFDMPVYPVDRITQLYVDNPRTDVPLLTFDSENGSVTFPKVYGTAKGQPVYAVCDPAIAVLYETNSADTIEITNTNVPDDVALLKDTKLLTTVDLNPANSGLARGIVYLQHRRFKPVSVTLSADKPQIPIPPTLSSIIGLIAYGPVFYNGDYALLSATAFGSLPGEVVPGAVLKVIPGGLNPGTNLPYLSTPFRGLINGQDPNTTAIRVITGGDGMANLVYLPEPRFGYYISVDTPWITFSSPGDMVQLPTPIPISQLWNSSEGWLVFIYQVLNDNPLFGLAGGSPALGQLPFVTNGTVNGNTTILSVDWAAQVLTYHLATTPSNLEIGQNILVADCTTIALNGTFSVLSINGNDVRVAMDVNPLFPLTHEDESGATLKYSNFRTNGVLKLVTVAALPLFPTHAFDAQGNDYTDMGFNGMVVQLQYPTPLPFDVYHTAAYFLQFLERQVIQLQVEGTTILSNTIMLQMQTPQQIFDNPYLVLSTEIDFGPPWPPGSVAANVESRMNINRLGILPEAGATPLTGRSTFSKP